MTAPALLLLLRLLLLTLDVCGARAAALALAAAGGTLPDPVYEDAIFAYTMVRPNVTISYAALGSVPGQCHIMAPPYPAKCTASTLLPPIAVDFAASDVPLDPGDYVLNPDLQMYPTVATSVVPVYNLNADVNLTLSTAVLAQVFSGQILTWDDPRIVALNPNFSTWRVPAGQRIEVVVRDSGSGTTGVFRQALCYFDTVFAQQVGPGTDAAWGGVNVTRSPRPQAYVTVTPYTIGFVPFSVAADYGLPTVRLRKGTGAVVQASVEATSFAMLELDMSFSSDPTHLTTQLVNAQGDRGWPIVTMTYLVMRKTAPRPGAGCDAVRETAAFWNWFWTSGMVLKIIQTNRFSPLPDMARDLVVRRFAAELRCDARPVLARPQPVAVPASGLEWVAPVVTKFGVVYGTVDPNVTVTYRSASPASEAELGQRLDTDAFVVSRLSHTAAGPSSVQLVVGGVAVAIISQYNITLDLPTLAAILDGNITTWLHPDMLRLNGRVLLGMSGLTNPFQRIVLFNGPTTQDSFLINTLRSYVPGFAGVALAAARCFPTESMLRGAVSATPFSLAVSALVGSFDSNLRFASLVRPGGGVAPRPVAPSAAAVQACATPDVYAAATRDVQLWRSLSPECYPLSSAVYITARKSQCDRVLDPQRTAAVAFLEWLLLHPSLPAALQDLRIAPLSLVPVVSDLNGQALAVLSCGPRPPAPTPDWLPTVAGACGGAVALLAAGAAVWVWKSTADVRALRRQFANDNVAQECAAAIASFDLEAVEWLKALERPNRIQQSFLQIIHLLTQVRPFIPDQLLATLQHSGSPTEKGEAVLARSFCQPPARRPSADSDSLSAVTSAGDLNPAPLSRGCSFREGLVARKSFRRTMTPLNVYTPLGSEWHRKVGAFMAVRFGFATTAADVEYQPQRMAAVLMDLVTIAKAHGATIDHVAYGSLALHWGVAFGTAQGPLKAATAAMEMADLRSLLPEVDRPALQLSVGLAYGPCDVSTASAAGHSFFV
eukprot:EG_transcript_1970